jgi:hypothetical protein
MKRLFVNYEWKEFYNIATRFFASFSAVGIIFVSRFLPNTKNKNPEEIAEFFQPKPQ